MRWRDSTISRRGDPKSLERTAASEQSSRRPEDYLVTNANPLYEMSQIEDIDGKTLVSEGIKANYQDMINYSVFCLIKMSTDNGR